MMRLGLTGGVAAGKSEAEGFFRALGVPTVDADVVARSLLEPGTQAHAKVRSLFGPEAFDAQQNINRPRLRQMILADPMRRRELDKTCHPLVRARMEELASAFDSAYCVLVIPLLVESGMTDFPEKIAVVDCEEAVQIKRLCQRDLCSKKEALAMLRAQASRRERLKVSDFVIENNGGLEKLRSQVHQLHELLVNKRKLGQSNRDC